MPITHINAFAEAASRYTYFSTIYKPVGTSSTTAAERYVDVSYSSGIPKFNAYAGSALTFTPLFGEGNAGIYTGPDAPAGKDKYIYQVTFHYDAATEVNSSGGNYILFCDYLGFYPLVDLSDDTPQVFNTPVAVPRQFEGKGVMAMLVTTVANTLTTTATMSYTDCEGVSRTTTFGIQTGNTGEIINTGGDTAVAGAVNPFIPVYCSGIREVSSIQLTTAAEGFASLVFVRPLFNMALNNWQVTGEKNLILNGGIPVKVENGAYLHMITKLRTNNRSFNLRGELLSTFL